jgi:tRNA/rRNA methyltransferase/tRNA (cytidine32/uridine32-2'-O)-methyltransferase
MKNCGLSRLALVAPAPVVLANEQTALDRAVHADDVWQAAEVFDTLAEAVAGYGLVVGTSRRRGRFRKPVTLAPDELAGKLADRPGNAALVFGNERTGLETAELALCGLASHIPANDAFPSFNLSHAVQIYAYELFRALAPAGSTPLSAALVSGTWMPIDKTAVDALTMRITNSLESLGFYKKTGRAMQEQFFHDIFTRAGLTENEAHYLQDIFAKAARLATHGPR